MSLAMLTAKKNSAVAENRTLFWIIQEMLIRIKFPKRRWRSL